MKITADRLRELLHYDADTGIFTWASRNRNIGIGDTAGWVHGTYGYRYIGIDSKQYRAQRLVWLYCYGKWPEDEIDHINGKRDDNRLCNLRDVSRLINSQNTRTVRASYANLSGAHKHRSRWHASININGVQKHLGSFSSAQEANQAYIEAKRKFHPGSTI